ncbi:MAG TPA: hypothetical protein VFR24_08040 [Candidatus Angelobacter sp.]|nr:hypothetical protein [Candidatus Angelobacter sp.]
MQWNSGYRVVCLLLVSVLAGCGGGNNSTQNPPPPAIGQIYVTKINEGSILRFRAGDNGDVPPQQRLGAPSAHTGPLCIDVAHDRLAGTSFDGAPIIVLIDDASSTPGQLTSREITGAATTMHDPAVCALDGTADLLYVVDTGNVAGGSSILIFGPASTASGNIPPLHTMLLPYLAFGIAVDPASNRIFVSDTTNNVIDIYDSASTLDGAVTPSRTIGGPLTQLGAVGPIAFESSGHLVVAPPSFANSPAVRVFSNAGTLNGNMAPSAVFSLSTGIVSQFAVTPAGDLYVVDSDPKIMVFSNIFSASGTISPVRVITGPHTDLDSPIFSPPPLVDGVAVDPTR